MKTRVVALASLLAAPGAFAASHARVEPVSPRVTAASALGASAAPLAAAPSSLSAAAIAPAAALAAPSAPAAAASAAFAAASSAGDGTFSARAARVMSSAREIARALNQLKQPEAVEGAPGLPRLSLVKHVLSKPALAGALLPAVARAGDMSHAQASGWALGIVAAGLAVVLGIRLARRSRSRVRQAGIESSRLADTPAVSWEYADDYADVLLKDPHSESEAARLAMIETLGLLLRSGLASPHPRMAAALSARAARGTAKEKAAVAEAFARMNRP